MQSHQLGVDVADLRNSACYLFLPDETRIFIKEGIYCPYVAVSPHLDALASGLAGDERQVGTRRIIKDGKRQSWVFQVADVNKVLASVSAMVDAGNRVVFDRDDATGTDLSFITCKATGESIKMRRDRNVWTIDAFVDEDAEFSRQE